MNSELISAMKKKELPRFLKVEGLYIANELKTIPKRRNIPFQPLYEAFMNSWEAASAENRSRCSIKISLYVKSTPLLVGDENNPRFEFEKLEVEDNGSGINDDGLKRLFTLRDDRKGLNNKGTGRIQYLHFFKSTRISSVYKTCNENYQYRELELSKESIFLHENSIIKLIKEEVAKNAETCTTVSFSEPLCQKDMNVYESADCDYIKSCLMRHFLALFCDNKSSMPKITINRIVNGDVTESVEIKESDVVLPDLSTKMFVNYKELDQHNKLQDVPEGEMLNVRTFKFPANKIDGNKMLLVSKGALGQEISLNCVRTNEVIDGKRYLFLISGNYIDCHDKDDRGNIELLSDKEIIELGANVLFPEKYITLDDVTKVANAKVIEEHPEIAKKEIEKEKRVKDLADFFCLEQRNIKKVIDSVKADDSNEAILKKFNKIEGDRTAKYYAKIKEQIDKINNLDPTSDDYVGELEESAKQIVAISPIVRRNELSKYVARRRLVLELFERILDKKIEALESKNKVPEKFLHNLFFRQHSSNPTSSDLWLLSDEYVYFSGCSEHKLEDIRYKGALVIDQEIPDKFKAELLVNGENRLRKRPDVLLFPEEGKCIIIEFKAPNENLALHLDQIRRYAGLIRNFSRDDLSITSFYGYLIGENVSNFDVRTSDPSFVLSTHFDFWFSPHTAVPGLVNGRTDGSLYMEILKYSTILNRAKQRNKIFIDKLFSSECNEGVCCSDE